MNEELEHFRRGFCFKAAELGYTPSELVNVKQADPLSAAAAAAKEIASFIADHGPSAVAALAVGGAGAGALGNYFYNKAKFELDPEDTILPDYGPVDEAKQLHLLAKYRNAKRLVNANIA